MTRKGIIKVCSEGTKQSEIENVFYFSLTSISFFSSRSTGKGWASVLKIQCSSGRRSSSENIKYKYLEREKKMRLYGTRKYVTKHIYTSCREPQMSVDSNAHHPYHGVSHALGASVWEPCGVIPGQPTQQRPEVPAETQTVMSTHPNWNGDHTSVIFGLWWMCSSWRHL